MTTNTNSPEGTLPTSSSLASELVTFGKGVVEVAREHAERLGVDMDDELRFPLQELLPTRVQAVRNHLAGGDLADPSPSDFLRASVTELRAEAEAAGDARALSDAVVQALEDLHSFVLAHGLVEPRYRLSQGIGWRSAAPRRRAVSWPPDDALRDALQRPDAHEYALAA